MTVGGVTEVTRSETTAVTHGGGGRRRRGSAGENNFGFERDNRQHADARLASTRDHEYT